MDHLAMDLQWQVARRREWIELGEREDLTFRELSERAGVSTRTLRRWSAALHAQRARDPLGQHMQRFRGRVERPNDQDRGQAEAKALDQSFVKVLEEPATLPPNRIQIVLGRGRRLMIDGAVDVEELAQVIAAVEQC